MGAEPQRAGGRRRVLENWAGAAPLQGVPRRISECSRHFVEKLGENLAMGPKELSTQNAGLNTWESAECLAQE